MIAVDIETTGTNPEKHSILSLGAVDFEEPTRQFYDECRVWDGAHVEEEALVINGFTEAEIRDSSKKSEAELVESFLAWAMEARGWNFLGQNASFDLSFVRAACGRAHLDFPFPHRVIDTHTLCYMHLVSRGVAPPFDLVHHHTGINLDFALRYVGIPEEPKPHNALTGALCHAEVASRLLYHRNLLPEFEMFPVPFTVPRVG